MGVCGYLVGLAILLLSYDEELHDNEEFVSQ